MTGEGGGEKERERLAGSWQEVWYLLREPGTACLLPELPHATAA